MKKTISLRGFSTYRLWTQLPSVEISYLPDVLMFAAAISAAMAWYGANLVMLDHASGTAAFASVPSWCVESILPIGFALLALRLATHAFLPQKSDAPALAPELP